MPMIRILDVETARTGVLDRTPTEPGTPPPGALDRLAAAVDAPVTDVEHGVRLILNAVRSGGDAALLTLCERLDGQRPAALEIPPDRVSAALARIEPALRAALEASASRIRRFHERQADAEGGWLLEEPGFRIGQRVVPLERIGIYVPGGQALYPSSLLMAAIPARVAGVKQIVAISPPSAERLGAGGPEGVADVILAAAAIAGVDRFFQVGGAQGIGALAYGTATIPAVDKILGPGGLFTVLAMRAVFGATGIAGLPGPTETLLIADDGANPALVAADLMAQAEHDVLASALLLTPSRSLAERVATEVEQQLARLPRRRIIEGSLARGSAIVVTSSLDEAIDLANDYAPEHLCLLTESPWSLVDRIQNAGGIFVGESACEALGDYIVGPSHIMPTGRTARFNSPVQLRDFQKIISIFGVEPAGLRATAADAIRIAEAEGLQGHAEAIRRRL